MDILGPYAEGDFIAHVMNITMVYVTHDQEEALTLSDHICVFKKGVVDQIGTPNEIYNKSRTEYTNNFIGDVNKLTPECRSSQSP